MNLNFSCKERKEIQSALKVNDTKFTKRIVRFNKSIEYKKLRELQVFEAIYERKLKDTKGAFAKYLMQFNVDFQKEGLWLVDVGWKGTMQDNIYQFWEGKVKVVGCYLGLNELTNVNKNNIKTGILFSEVPYKTNFYRQFSANYLIYEDVLHAPHSAVKDYKITNEIVEVIYDEREADSLYILAEKIQTMIMSKYVKILDCFADTVYSADDFTELFARFMVKGIKNCKMSDVDIYIQMDKEHLNNFISNTGVTVKENGIDSPKKA